MLFHVTANSDWSNLPLSGLFVEMLRRVVALGPSQVTIDTGKQDATVEASPAASTTPAASTSALRRFRRSTASASWARRRCARLPSLPTSSTRWCPAPIIRPAITARRVPRAPSTSSPPRPCSSRWRRRRIERDRRLHHEEANGARALALSRRHRTVRHRYPCHAGVERRGTAPPPRRRHRRHLARAGAPAEPAIAPRRRTLRKALPDRKPGPRLRPPLPPISATPTTTEHH